MGGKYGAGGGSDESGREVVSRPNFGGRVTALALDRNERKTMRHIIAMLTDCRIVFLSCLSSASVVACPPALGLITMRRET